MAQVKPVMMGCPITTNRGMFGIPTIVLIQGRFTTLYDVGHYSTRHQLLDGLKEHGVTPGKIDKVILSHLHWDHALYMDPFRSAEVIVASDEHAQASDEKRRDSGTPPFMVDMLRSHKVRLRPGGRGNRAGGAATEGSRPHRWHVGGQGDGWNRDACHCGGCGSAC